MMSYIIVRVEKPIWHRRPIQNVYTTRGTSPAALMVMVMAWGVSYVVSTSMWVVIEVGSGPREILSGRIFVRAPNKMGRIFADIMRPSVRPTVEFETTLLGWFLQYDSPHLRTNWYQYGWYLLQWPSKLDEASGTCGKYYFGRIIPLIRQCRPSVLPEFYLVKSRSCT
jgi:hypothetical protein